jgi:uncharacterized protein (TIGR03086 family)
MTRAAEAAVTADAVELLERSLTWTSGALAEVRTDLLDRPTPCDRWRLRDLLAHMEDALDAFTEAAAGHVAVGPVPLPADAGDRCGRLRAKACTLLGAWSLAQESGAPGRVLLRGRGPGVGLDPDVLVRAAALEITVHGWDVARTTRDPEDPALPPALARDLLPTAHLLVPRDGRAGRFADPTAYDPTGCDPGASGPTIELLAWLGRRPGSS